MEVVQRAREQHRVEGGFLEIGPCRVPGIDPAYAVSLLCMAAGILALMLCILIQVRLGVNAWIASAFVLALAAHERVWSNLVAPEVYAPSLLFLVSAAYLLIKYARVGARRDLWWAAALFGVVLANRPTVVWMLPFFLAAWWHCSRAVARRRRPSRHRSAITPLGATLFAAVPGLYSLGYVWVRDTPNTPYNYLEQKRIESNSLPDTRNGFGAKLERLHWLVTAREFEGLIGNTGRGVRSRLRWLYREFFLYSVVDFVGMTFTIGFTTFVTVTVILVIGGVQVYFRCPA
ncbi:MAG: glycosyltransferase family 39 protein, partial [Bacteroidetes bacterium]|nr:glycosyltransferase family 39 protein [Bacteroidota bacterium]